MWIPNPLGFDFGVRFWLQSVQAVLESAALSFHTCIFVICPHALQKTVFRLTGIYFHYLGYWPSSCRATSVIFSWSSKKCFCCRVPFYSSQNEPTIMIFLGYIIAQWVVSSAAGYLTFIFSRHRQSACKCRLYLVAAMRNAARSELRAVWNFSKFIIQVFVHFAWLPFGRISYILLRRIPRIFLNIWSYAVVCLPIARFPHLR